MYHTAGVLYKMQHQRPDTLRLATEMNKFDHDFNILKILNTEISTEKKTYMK